jgi:hypothetical protein
MISSSWLVVPYNVLQFFNSYSVKAQFKALSWVFSSAVLQYNNSDESKQQQKTKNSVKIGPITFCKVTRGEWACTGGVELVVS